MLPSQTACPLRLILRHGVRFHAVHNKHPAVLSACLTSATQHRECSVSISATQSSSARLALTAHQPATTPHTPYLTTPNTHTHTPSSTSQRRPFTSSCAMYQTTTTTTKNDRAELSAVRLENGAKIKAIMECGSLEELRAHAHNNVESVFLACVIMQRLSSLAKEKGMSAAEVEALLVEDPALRSVCKMIDGNVTRLSPKAVLNTLQSLYEVTNTDLYITKSLATQMIWLLRRLPFSMVVQTLQVHLRYHGINSSHQVASSVVDQCLDVVSRRWVELTSPRDIIYLMYVAHSASPLANQVLLERLEDRALDMVEKASPKELYRVVYLLSRQGHRNTPLIRAAVYHLNKHSLSSLSAVQLTNLAYACCTLNVFDSPLMAKISAELKSGSSGDSASDASAKLREVTPKLASSLLTSFSRLRWKEEGVIGALIGVLLDGGGKAGGREKSASSTTSSFSSTSSSVEQESTVTVEKASGGDFSSLEAADKAGVVLSLANLGVDTVQSQALVRKITAQADVQSLRELSPLLWLDVVWSLCILGLADASSVSSVLSEDFQAKLSATEDSFQSLIQQTKIHNINCAARLELQPYDGPLLPPNFPVPDAKLLQRGERKAGEKLLAALTNTAPLETYTTTNTTVSGGYLIDAEFYVDGSGNPKPLSQVSENAADLHRVALKVLDFPDLTLGSSDLTGLHVMAQRHLQAQGYTVLQVKHTDVPSHSKVVELVNFLQQRVKDVLKVKDAPKVKVTADAEDVTKADFF